MRRVLVGAAAVALMAACGGGGDAGNDMDTPPPAPPATTTPPPTTGGNVMLPDGVTQEMVTQGQAIFTGAGACTACHGPDATGTPLAPNLTDSTWLNLQNGTYDEIVNLIMTGVPQPKEAPAPMMPKGGSTITDEQVRQVAAYVYSISHGG